jgi:hypothetical protein
VPNFQWVWKYSCLKLARTDPIFVRGNGWKAKSTKKKTSSFNHADHSYKLTCQRIPCATLFCPYTTEIYNMIRCVFPAAMLLFMPLYCRCPRDICDEFRRPCCCLCRHIAVVIEMWMTTSGACCCRYDVTLFCPGSPIQPKYKTLTRQK